MDEGQERLLSRRAVLATGASVVVGLTLPALSAQAASPRPVRSGWRRSRFAAHVGTGVTLRPAGGAATAAVLAAIEDVPYVASLAGDEDAYTLRFQGPAAPVLAEGVVGIRHRAFGAIDMYLTPVPAAPGRQDYLATVNRHVPRRRRRA